VPPDPGVLDKLSGPAKMALTSLEERPDLNTPNAISAGPFGLQNISAEEFAAGLRELEAAGLATQSFSGWRLVNRLG
jgi:hypothetical protein